jgi:hypothetical protein
MADLARLFRQLNFEQRVAALGALLLAVSTFGPFSFVELAEITIALGVLALLRARALGKPFHLPFGDGTVIAAAGVWAGLLIVVRLFDRPLGQNLLALVCAAVLAFAGVLERATRPADDLPEDAPPQPPRRPRRPRPGPAAAGETPTEPLPPPEFKPHEPEPGQQLRLGGEESKPQPPPGDA